MQWLLKNGFQLVHGDHCQYGFGTWLTSLEWLPIRKRTSYMIPEGSFLKFYLSKLCDGTHEHAKVQRTIARDAGEYTMSLSRAIVAGAVHQAASASQWMGHYTRGLRLPNDTAMQKYDKTEEIAKISSLVPERIQVFAGWANKSLLPNVPGQFVRRLLCVYDNC